ncbi:MAG: formyl transferase [Micrococcales bacterium]|nr:MAG: formyl transferase [Micrococcales bacterium]PIE26099.1 MAG: formyl transferase [Micrococcales bacterium]
MKIIFAGFGDLGAAVLEPLLKVHEVLAVLTHPDRFTGLEGQVVRYLALHAHVPLFLSAAGRDPGLTAQLRDLGADVLVSTNWRTRMPPDLLEVARLGAVNVHDSLLPTYAGFGSVNWVIRDGLDHIGLTVHYMTEELDTGPIILQTRLEIGADEDATSVTQRLTARYGDSLLSALEEVAAGSTGRAQDPAKGSFGHRITIEDTRIDWGLSTRQILDLVRAQSTPFVNAWAMDGSERLFITRAIAPGRAARGTPGRVMARADGGVLVACGPPGGPDSRGVIVTRVRAGDAGDEVDAVAHFGPVRGARYLT